VIPSCAMAAKAAFADMTPHFNDPRDQWISAQANDRARTVLRIPICALDLPSKDFGMAGRPA
jgi:hypothetical protein